MRRILAVALLLPAAHAMAQSSAQSASTCQTAAATGAGASTSSGGQFGVLNGQIYDPNQKVFVPRGIDTGPQQLINDPQQILDMFPGINFIRVGMPSYENPADFAQAVQLLSSHGVMVEFEDHTSSDGGDRGGAAGVVYTGRQLATELAWYSSMASYYKNNPYVAFGTDNEPSVTPSVAAVSQWQKQTYDAIRATGSNALIYLETVGGWEGQTVNAGMVQADYSGMTNTAWDLHFYGGAASLATDQTTVNQDLAREVSQAQQITSAAGTMPVSVLEYGPSTMDDGPDADAQQVINAVTNSPTVGSAAWQFNPGAGNPDNVTSGDGLSAYGQQVAAYIKNGPANPCQAPATGVNVTPNVNVSSLSLPTAPAAPMTTAPDQAPTTAYTPPGQSQGTLAVGSVPVTAAPSPTTGQPITLSGSPAGSQAPLNYLDQGSWWTSNPVAANAERALCGAAPAGGDLYAQYCGDAGGVSQ